MDRVGKRLSEIPFDQLQVGLKVLSYDGKSTGEIAHLLQKTDDEGCSIKSTQTVVIYTTSPLGTKLLVTYPHVKSDYNMGWSSALLLALCDWHVDRKYL